MKQELKQLADISGHKILGNPNSEKGNIQEIDMGFGLSFSGGTVSVDLELNDLIDVTTNFPLNPTEADDGKMLFYDHSIGEWTTDDAVTHGTVVINGKKASAGTISKGLPVYLVGFDNDLHTVELANSTSGSTMPVIGFTSENMNSTDSKHIITFGKLTGINTTSTVTTLNPNGETWAVNDVLYISTTSGGLTKFRPTGGTTQIQRIAKVLRVSSTGGQLFIFNTARTAGLPNLSTNKLWMGNNNGQPIEMSLGDGFTLSSGTISVDANYGNLYIESTGNYSTIRKDISASATALYSSVLGGCVNTSSACYGTILNGRMNTILGGPYNSILNGNSNTNSGYISSNITSGTNNIIATPSQYSTIDNGTNNNMNGCYSVILNGSNNDIETTSQYSIIGSGVSNVSVGSFNVINSGQSNTIDGSSTNISTGRFNTISGSYNNISTGTYNTISGSTNFIGSGSSNTLTGSCMSVLGNNIVATYSNTTYVNKLIINDTPTTNNSNTNLLVRNSSGQIELREASSFSGTNFANTDLTFTGNRTHQLNGNSLNINNGATNVFAVNSFNDVLARGKGTTNNAIIGFNTARSLTSSDVTILGDLAGQNLTTGGNNVLLGRSAGQGLTTGPSNVMIGRDAGLSLTTISESVFIGRDAGRNIPGVPSRSVVIGAQAMRDGGGTDNTAIGNQALLGGGSQFNVAVGALAGSTNVGGGTNVFIGYNAQPLSDTNFGSIVIGGSSVGYGSNTAVLGASGITLTRLRGRVEMNQITTQPTITDNSSYAIWFNSGIPTIRLKDNLGISSNIAINDTNFANTDLTLTGNRTHNLNGNTLSLTNGATEVFRINQFNDVIARGKGDSTNTHFGLDVLRSNTSGIQNTVYGQDITGITSGQVNSYFGYRTARFNNGTGNSFFGGFAGLDLTTGNNNVIIGRSAAFATNAGGTVSNLENSIVIGETARVLNSGDVNTIVIGRNSRGLGSNTVVIGNSDITRTQLRGRVEMDTTTDGILLPRLTTAQMNAVASPVTNTILYNTDLNGLYRYNGSAWVALSAGYGIIGVYSGSGNGTPVFFADLQSALETCKASGGYFTVKLYSNLTITSSINIDYAGSGVGGAYLFRQLTIDFNGFSVTNAQADTSNAFTISLSNNVAVYQEIRFINGTVLRTNGTSTHHALKCDTINRYGTIQMSKMYWYCQNNHAARIGVRLSTAANAGKVCDLGGSVFVSNGTQRTLGLVNSEQTVTNFSCISTTSLAALYLEGGVAQNFYAENTSTGEAILQIGGIANNFISKSNGGISLDISGAEAHNFVARSTGTNATAVFVKSSGLITNFKCDAVDSYALQVDSSGVAINGFCQNNSNTRATIQTSGHNRMDNIEGINLGASFGGRIQGGNLTKCKFISVGGIGAQLYSWGPYPPAGLTAEGCTFESRLNTSGGHSCQVVPISAGVFLLTNCYFLVTNSGANAINATSAVTVRSRYCTHNEVASTPINANVTIVSSGIIS